MVIQDNINKGLLFENDEESSLVAEAGEISNLDLIKDIDKIVKLVEVLNM